MSPMAGMQENLHKETMERMEKIKADIERYKWV